MNGFVSQGSSIGGIYNPSYYKSSGKYLTLSTADQSYVKLYDARMGYMSNVVPGTATGGKALIIDGSKNITSLGSVSCSSLTVNGVAITTNGGGGSTSTFDPWGTGYSYRSILRASTTWGNGLEIMDNQQLNETNTVLSFKTSNGYYPKYLRFHPPIYNSADATGTAYGQSFVIGTNESGYWHSGGHFSTSATSAGGYSEADRLHLSVNNCKEPYLTLNPKYGQLHLRPTSLGDLNTNHSGFYIIANQAMKCTSALKCQYLQVGTSTDTGRMISALDSAQSTGTSRYICWGYDASGLNQAELAFYLAGSGSSSNRIDFGFYGGSAMSLTASSRLGIGTTSPSCALDVATGENAVTVAANIGVNAYSYQISSNTWGNFGAGPYSPNICARFRGSVWIQDRLWASSDRRLKTDIAPIDFDLEHYKQLNPVSYKWKNRDSLQLGLIAQEVLGVCSEAVNFTENENMKKESEDDAEGVVLSVDYNAINMMNVVAIKKLISRVEQLEALVDSISLYGPLSKHLKKSV